MKWMDLLDIVNGPSKFNLMVSLFGETARIPVNFSFKDGTEVDVFISSIQREDNSGESWNFQGYATPSNNKVGGYYSTRTRKGTLKFQ